MKNIYKLEKFFEGRLGRVDFLIGNIISVAILTIFSIFCTIIVTSIKDIPALLGIMIFPCLLLIVLFNLSIWIRRGHDMGWGWVSTTILWILQIFLFFPFLILLFKKGEDRENVWGKQPTNGTWENLFNTK